MYSCQLCEVTKFKGIPGFFVKLVDIDKNVADEEVQHEFEAAGKTFSSFYLNMSTQTNIQQCLCWKISRVGLGRTLTTNLQESP